MSIEIILTLLIGGAVIALVFIFTQAKNETQIDSVVPVKSLEENPQPLVVNASLTVNSVSGDEEIKKTLEKKILDLKEQVNDAQEILEANDRLRFDNLSLKTELTQITEKYRDILSKSDNLKQVFEGQISNLIKEKEILLEQLNNDVKSQTQLLAQEGDDLRRTQEKLKELNSTTSAKNELLQYELIKSRAQSAGFERISLNYRKQLEDLMGQMQGVNQEYSQMSQHKNRLETMVGEMKHAHEELSRREQLMKFELAKARNTSGS